MALRRMAASRPPSSQRPASLEESREILVAKLVPSRCLITKSTPLRRGQSLRHCWYLRLA